MEHKNLYLAHFETVERETKVLNPVEKLDSFIWDATGIDSMLNRSIDAPSVEVQYPPNRMSHEYLLNRDRVNTWR